MDTPFDQLVIPRDIFEAMIAHTLAELPNECCGVLIGTISNRIGTVSGCFPVRNDLRSPKSYLTNARDLLDVHKATRISHSEWLAIYHSHPTSEPVPSKTDLAHNTYGESLMHLILGCI